MSYTLSHHFLASPHTASFLILSHTASFLTYPSPRRNIMDLATKAKHSFTYTSVDDEEHALVGTLYVFQTSHVLDYLYANTQRLLSLGPFDNVELRAALLASPITVLGISSGTIMGFAVLGEKTIACKNEWIGLPEKRFTTDLVSCVVSAFSSVRGLRKPLATYVCAVAHACGYNVVSIPQPYNAFFSCIKTDIMGSRSLYVTRSKKAFAPIAMNKQSVAPWAVSWIPPYDDKMFDPSFAHICGCDFKEELFATVLPSLNFPPLPALVVVDECNEVLGQMCSIVGMSEDFMDGWFQARPRAFSLEEMTPPDVYTVPAKRMRMTTV